MKKSYQTLTLTTEQWSTLEVILENATKADIYPKDWRPMVRRVLRRMENAPFTDSKGRPCRVGR